MECQLCNQRVTGAGWNRGPFREGSGAEVGLVIGMAMRNLLFVKRFPVKVLYNSTNEKVLLARKAAARMVARWNAEQNGSSLIEFALVMPVMLLVMTGIFSMGMAFNQQEQLTQ